VAVALLRKPKSVVVMRQRRRARPPWEHLCGDG
jgi:hypothetical protein